MVILLFPISVAVGRWLPLAVQGAVPNELPPPTRAVAMMALLGVALLGLFLIAVIMLGGHWVRRLGRYRRGPAVPSDVFPEGLLSSPESLPSARLRSDLSSSAGTTLDGDTVRIDDTMSS